MAAYTTMDEINEVLKRYERSMFYFVLRGVKYDKQLAEDIYQNALIKIFLGLKDGKYTSAKGDVSTWMYRICLNTINDHYRNDKKNPAAVNKNLFDEELFEEGSTFYTVVRKIVADKELELQDRERKILQGAQFELIKTSIDKIKGFDARMSLRYQFVDGMRGQEIAVLLGIEEKTVRTNIHRAKKQLKDIMLKDNLIAA